MLIGGFTPAVGKVYSFCKNSRILIQKHQYFYRNSFPVIFGETASNKIFTESAKDCREVSIEINGCSGASKGDEIPVAMVIIGALALGMTTTAFAANDPLTVVNNLSDFIFGLIRAIGLILLGFGIVQVGLSLKSHDPSQRANGFLTLAGGIIITFAKEILTLITG